MRITQSQLITAARTEYEYWAALPVLGIPQDVKPWEDMTVDLQTDHIRCARQVLESVGMEVEG